MKEKILVGLLILAIISVGSIQAVPPTERETIVDVAISINEDTSEFSILIAALLAADPAVIQTLDGNGQFTVFAPTDAAFVALLGELGLTAEELLAEKELVTQVLLYHVARGRLYAEDVIEKERIRTLQRGFLYVDGTELTDNNGRTSNIILDAVDVEADNGIIHVIDTVVLP
jgi:uncharacterized surface protein with fasciclin (FAS1) repeats